MGGDRGPAKPQDVSLTVLSNCITFAVSFDHLSDLRQETISFNAIHISLLQRQNLPFGEKASPVCVQVYEKRVLRVRFVGLY